MIKNKLLDIIIGISFLIIFSTVITITAFALVLTLPLLAVGSPLFLPVAIVGAVSVLSLLPLFKFSIVELNQPTKSITNFLKKIKSKLFKNKKNKEQKIKDTKNISQTKIENESKIYDLNDKKNNFYTTEINSIDLHFQNKPSINGYKSPNIED